MTPEMADSERARPTLVEQACRNLWAAALAQAVEDFLTEPMDLRSLPACVGRSRRYEYGRSLLNQHELRAVRVYRWLFEDGLDETGSAGWVCEALGLDLEYVRRRAKERRTLMRTFMTVS